MNETKIAELKQKISKSPIFSEKEREEWLLMLPIMNDKQLGDLEMILIGGEGSGGVTASTGQAQKQTVVEPLRPVVVSKKPVDPKNPPQPTSFMPPKLTHIANVPADVVKNTAPNNNQPSIEPAKINPPSPHQVMPATKAEWDEEFAREMSEAELPPARAVPSLPSGEGLVALNHAPDAQAVPFKPLRPVVKTSAQEKPSTPPVPLASPPPAPATPRSDDFWSTLLEPKRAQEFVEVATATRTPHAASGPVITKIGSLADIALLSLSSLREMTPKALIATLQGMVRQYSYERVLEAFEQSSLYALYVSAGSLALEKNVSFEQLESSKSTNNLPLSRAEFEIIADVLKNIQVN